MGGTDLGGAGEGLSFQLVEEECFQVGKDGMTWLRHPATCLWSTAVLDLWLSQGSSMPRDQLSHLGTRDPYMSDPRTAERMEGLHSSSSCIHSLRKQFLSASSMPGTCRGQGKPGQVGTCLILLLLLGPLFPVP